MQVAALRDAGFRRPTFLETAFREHHGRVFRAAHRITGNPQDAEDILQTVFLRLAQKGDVTVENVSSYLYRAAINASIDLLRGRRDRGTVALEEARAVRSAEASTAFSSHGESERKSSTSASTPACSSAAAACSQSLIVFPQPMSVRSRPERTRRDVPIGTKWFSTSSEVVAAGSLRQLLG